MQYGNSLNLFYSHLAGVFLVFLAYSRLSQKVKSLTYHQNCIVYFFLNLLVNFFTIKELA